MCASEFEDFVFIDVEQGTDLWHALRANRVGGSSLGSAIGMGYDDPLDTAEYMTGVRTKKFSKASERFMKVGVENEDYVREMYTEITGNKVEEIGYCIWKKDPRLAVSVDGVVISDDCISPDKKINLLNSEGIIEIKCPQKMYKGLLDDKDRDLKNYSHILPSHYCQMQLGMKILNKKWADYIVYCPNTGDIYIDRIPFNETFWSEIETKLEDFFNMIDSLDYIDYNGPEDYVDIIDRFTDTN